MKPLINNKLHQQAETAVLQLLPSVDMNPVGVEGLRIFLLLNELLHACIQKCRWQQSKKLADAVAATMQRLPNESVQMLGTVTPTIFLLAVPTLVQFSHQHHSIQLQQFSKQLMHFS